MTKDDRTQPRRLAIVPKQVLRLACVSVVPVLVGAGCTKTNTADAGSGGAGGAGGYGGYSGAIALAIAGFAGGPIALAIAGFGGAGFGGGVIMLGVGGFAGQPGPLDAGPADAEVDDDGGTDPDATLADEDSGT